MENSGGSSRPVAPTQTRDVAGTLVRTRLRKSAGCAAVVQQAEHCFGKAEVRGSIPLCGFVAVR